MPFRNYLFTGVYAICAEIAFRIIKISEESKYLFSLLISNVLLISAIAIRYVFKLSYVTQSQSIHVWCIL